MKIRVLHIFAPSLKSRFSGQNITWKYNFDHWNNPKAIHFVLDCKKNQLVSSREAFGFEYPVTQLMSSKKERGLWIIELFVNLVKFRNEYDIIHFHVLWWGSLLVALWAKWKKIPAIYESVLLESDTPGAILIESLGKLKLKLLKSFRAILAISEYLAEDYLKHGFSKDQVCTLMNSVDTEMFHPITSPSGKSDLRQKHELPQNAIILLFVGSVIERKGVDILIQGFIEASMKCPDLYLVIIGPNNKKENPSLDEKFIKGLNTLLKDANLGSQVNFGGLVKDRNALAEIYRTSDIFVFPSRNEGLGNVVLEAMASGMPVVVSQLPVLRTVINHEENGLVVPIGDAHSLAEAICSISENPTLALKLGKAAQNYILENHTFNEWQSQTTQFYLGLKS